MNKLTVVLSILSLLVLSIVSNASAGKIYSFKNSGGEIYKICLDNDGFVVYKPGGGQDVINNNQTWQQVQNSYGLGGPIHETTESYNNCP